MRASIASLSRKFISVFFAATLALGLVPAAAFAQPEDDAAVAQGSTTADEQAQENAPGSEGNAGVEGDASTDASIEGGEGNASTNVISSEGDEVPNPHVISTEPSDSEASGEISSPGDGDGAALPAGDMINQEMELDTVVAQAESTRSFFLAQTLESTRTVPVVSAKLPIDTRANDVADAPAEDGAPSSEGEGSGNFDGASGSDDPVDPSFTLGSSEGDSAAVAEESTVIGSFIYLGMTFAIEPGGESVALMAVDYPKLPEEYIQKQVLVIPDTATPDGIDYYSVTRIADDAFAGLTKESANPDYVGCEALFTDKELLAKVGISQEEVQQFLSDDGAAAAAQKGESANADSGVQAQAEACAYGDQATSEPAEGDGAAPQVISGEVNLSDDPSQHVISSDKDEASPANVISSEGAEADPNPHVISSGASEAGGVEKSRPSDEDGGEASADSDDAIRTIVSMEGNTATLNDGSIYEFTNPLAGCTGILALGIPASVATIEDDALSGFTTLQYVVVSEDNSTYASYDGALYSADLTNLRLIPEGRVGAVRVAPSATGVDPEVFSHCPSVDALVADAEGGAYQLLQENDGKYLNGNRESIRFLKSQMEPSTYSEDSGKKLQTVIGSLEQQIDSEETLLLNRSSYGAETLTRTFPTLRYYARETVYTQWNAIRNSDTPIGGASLTVTGDTLLDRHILLTVDWSAENQSFSAGFTDPETHGAAGAFLFTNSAFDWRTYKQTGTKGGVHTLHFQNKAAFQDKTAKQLTQYSGSQVVPETGLAEVWVNGYTSFMELSEEYLPNGGAWATVDNHAINTTDSKLYEHANTHYGYAASKRNATVRSAPENAPYNKPIFAGWRCLNDGKTYKPGDVIANSGELLRFEAQWSSDFTLKWSKNTTDTSVGGMPDERAISASSAGTAAVNNAGLKSVYASTAVLPSTPVREGWVFAGWYLDAARQTRVTDAVLAKKIVSSNYSGTDAASCIKTASDGSITLYAGWAKPYDNLKVFADRTVYVAWNKELSTIDATKGANYRILGNSHDSMKFDPFISKIVLSFGNGRVVAYVRASSTGEEGGSICYLTASEGVLPSTVNGGISKVHIQDTRSFRNKTVRRYDTSGVQIPLLSNGQVRMWLNDYRYQMWLSEEYLPNGGTWALADANATSADDSKYYEHANKTYDGTTSTTVTVRPAPDNVPVGAPVFLGWKCEQDGKVYQPGNVIQNVKQPLRFEAQWSPSFTLKWDANTKNQWTGEAGTDQVSSMPTDRTIAANAVGNTALNAHGIKSIYPNVASLPTTPSRQGRMFAGWYLDAKCQVRVTDAVLSKVLVSSNYNGSDVDNCIKAAPGGTLTLYAGWAYPFRNLTVFSDKTLFVKWNSEVTSFDARNGATYRILGNSQDQDASSGEKDLCDIQVENGVLRAGRSFDGGASRGVSLCYVNADPDTGFTGVGGGGVTQIRVQDSDALRNKTVRLYTGTELVSLAPNGKMKAWINDYRNKMWLSEEYLPNGGTWDTVDANAMSADDSKYYEHIDDTYDGRTSTDVIVRGAPENAPEDRPVFIGWKCKKMDGSYLDGVFQPGNVIENVMEPLVFEAQWTDIYNVSVPLMVGVAVDPDTGDVKLSENARILTTNPSSVEVVSLGYDLVAPEDDLDGSGTAPVLGGGTAKVFSDDEGSSYLDAVSLIIFAERASEANVSDPEPLEIPLATADRIDDPDKLREAGFGPFGSGEENALKLVYGLRFDREGAELVEMLSKLNLPEKNEGNPENASDEAYPIAKLFYTIELAS